MIVFFGTKPGSEDHHFVISEPVPENVDPNHLFVRTLLNMRPMYTYKIEVVGSIKNSTSNGEIESILVVLPEKRVVNKCFHNFF